MKASGIFGAGPRRNANEVSESVERKLWLLLELLRRRRVRYVDYEQLHGRNMRSFQRDLQQLRAVGKSAGFMISKIEHGGSVRLESKDAGLRRLDGAGPPLLRLIAQVAEALGEPIRGELATVLSEAPEGESFLHVQAPRLAEGSHVARVYERLRDAWASPTGRAEVRFTYRGAREDSVVERTVDPHRVIVRSGRYYLVGYDLDRRGWRIFALDAIAGVPTKAGTATARRTMPPAYASEDTLGFIRSAGSPIAVTVEFDAGVAASAASRVWQHGQVVERGSRGRAQLTVTVSDVDEIVRWVLGFGAQARIVRPPAAVRAAREQVAAILQLYSDGSANSAKDGSKTGPIRGTGRTHVSLRQ